MGRALPRRRSPRCARWRHEALQPHVGDEIAVVFEIVRRVEREYAEARVRARQEELDGLVGRRRGQTVESRLTELERRLEGGFEVRFCGLGFLDSLHLGLLVGR